MKKVICPGEALIDFISMNNSKVLKDTNVFLKKAGGAPANVAAAIAKLGGEAYFCGTIGNDFFGEFLKETFKKNNINTDLMFKLNNINTTLAFVSLNDNGERDFSFIRGADEFLSIDMIKNYLLNFDLYHFGSATAFLEGKLKETYYELKKYALNNNKLISFDANYREDLFNNNKKEFIKCCKDFIKDSYIVKLSYEEALLISNKEDIDEATIYIKSLGCENLIITLGEKGSILMTKEYKTIVPTIKLEMKDSTGAGDAFMGAIIVQLLNNSEKDMIEIVRLANLVGGLTTTNFGGVESIPNWTDVYFLDKNKYI